MAAVYMTLVSLPALGRPAGLTATFVGWVLAVRAVASMAVRSVTGRLVRPVGRQPVLLTGMCPHRPARSSPSPCGPNPPS
jgi:MFS family permease